MKRLNLITFAIAVAFMTGCAPVETVKRTDVQAEAGNTSVQAEATPVSSEFKPSTVSALVAETGLAEMLAEAKENDYSFMPPIFRYSLLVTTTGKIRPISAQHKQATTYYAKVNHADAFTSRFTHEIEVSEGGKTFWIIWQQALIAPFELEMSSGGSMEVNVLLFGARGQDVLFFGIGYSQVRG
jgi:hypothetical protein